MLKQGFLTTLITLLMALQNQILESGDGTAT